MLRAPPPYPYPLVQAHQRPPLHPPPTTPTIHPPHILTIHAPSAPRASRSYKYLTDDSLAEFPFGFGLSYTTFELEQAALEKSTAGHKLDVPAWATNPHSHFAAPAALRLELEATVLGTVSVTVTNTGTVAGDEVVFLFQDPSGPAQRWTETGTAVPNRQLVDFQRVSLEPEESVEVTFKVTARQLSTVDVSGTRHLLPGAHELVLSRGHGSELVVQFDVDIGAENERLILSTMLLE